jgi:hypothetical protein
LDIGMTISAESDTQDLLTIEAAVKGTARGRAFLADYARRVRQSDTLTMLAMLGKLERFCDELVARIAHLEAGTPSCVHDAASAKGGVASLEPFAPSTAYDGASHPMQRIDELASMFGNLHRHAVQLDSRSADSDERSDSASSIEIDARAFNPPDPVLLSSRPAGDRDLADEDVLGKIAHALEP